MAKEIKVDEQYVRQLISNNIKRFRSLRNISQLSLAVSTGLTHNFINDVENCKKGVSAKTIAKLSTAFNVEPYQFFLPENTSDNGIMIYMKDFTDSLQKAVTDLTDQYLGGDKIKSG